MSFMETPYPLHPYITPHIARISPTHYTHVLSFLESSLHPWTDSCVWSVALAPVAIGGYMIKELPHKATKIVDVSEINKINPTLDQPSEPSL